MPQTEATNRLAEAVDRLTETVAGERQARRLGIKIMVAAAVVVVGLFSWVLRDNRHELAAFKANRTEARVAGCDGYNEQQGRSRAGNKAQVRVVFDFLTGDRALTADEQAQLDELYTLHDEAIDKAFPDRDCSPAGIAAYYEEPKP